MLSNGCFLSRHNVASFMITNNIISDIGTLPYETQRCGLFKTYALNG